MATQGSTVGKGHLLRGLDALLTQTSQYQQHLDDLRRGRDSLVDIATKQKILTTQADQTHAEKEALGGAKEARAWWPNVPDKEAILREGFIKAYEIALRDPKNIAPIQTFWIPGWSSFAVVAMPGPGSVTLLLILTPPPPPGRLTGTIDQDMFVVANESTIDAILDGYANRADAEKNVTKTAYPGVQVFQVKGA
jgi:hypothetical protein